MLGKQQRRALTQSFQMVKRPKAQKMPDLPKTPLYKRLTDSVYSEDFPPTPTSRPSRIQSKHTRMGQSSRDKILLRRFKSSSTVPLRRSARLSELRGEDPNSNLPSLSKIDQQIQKRMIELQNVNTDELKQELRKRGQVKVTPENSGRPLYNLQDSESVITRFIDDEAIRLLEMENEEEPKQRPGVARMTRSLFH